MQLVAEIPGWQLFDTERPSSRGWRTFKLVREGPQRRKGTGRHTWWVGFKDQRPYHNENLAHLAKNYPGALAWMRDKIRHLAPIAT
jgi:hypothetical protein